MAEKIYLAKNAQKIFKNATNSYYQVTQLLFRKLLKTSFSTNVTVEK
jgi:hypothetical protein